jgi:CubicO group peptidase (beta-lactamase class C family)
MKRLLPVFVFLLCGLILLAAESVPHFAPSGPDAANYGEAQHFPVGGPHDVNSPQFLIGSYSHFDSIFPARGVPHGMNVWSFHRSAEEPQISYSYAGQRNTVTDYLSHVHVTGLLLAKDDTILLERYQYGRTDRDRFTSASMVKTLAAMLLGIAAEGNPKVTLDKKAGEFVPELSNTGYGSISLRDLLHMSSGMGADERELFHQLYLHRASSDAAVLAGFKESVAKPGTKFQYSCADSETLGLVTRSLAGRPLASYLGEKIWEPIGAEEDASWAIDTTAQEIPCFGFNATLRDWARVGRLLAWDGSWNGSQLIPKQWIQDATTVRATDTQLEPGKAARYFGYGYQLWIFPGERRMFALLGSEGQYVFVDPTSKMVLVQTAVEPHAMGAVGETIHLWKALLQEFGGTRG